MIIKVDEYQCKVCGMVMNAIECATHFDLPKAGDLSICTNCFSVSVWEENGQIRVATSAECEYVPVWLRKKIAEACDVRKPS